MKRYYSFSDYCRMHFGRKLYKVSLDAGMTCPNRDGKLDWRGCIFCSEGGSGDFALSYHGQKLSREDLIYNHQNAGPGDFIAYFQAYTNTYAEPEVLWKLFSSALEDPLFAGISIATRPDCVEKPVLDILHRLILAYPDKFIWVELGLQTVNENSARFIRRGYPLQVYDRAVKQLHELDIPVITHVIIGLPGETEEDVYATVRHLNEVHTDGVKLQLLHYLRETDLGRMYEEHPERFHVLSKEEYVSLVTECIGRLDEEIVIHRLTGDGNGDYLLAPLWSRNKRSVLNAIEHELKEKNIRQGSLKGDMMTEKEYALMIRKVFGEGDAVRDRDLKSPADVVRYDDIIYGHEDEKMQVLDVYRPKEAEGKKLPVILNIHGGAWVYGGREVYQYYCMSLAERGFAVVNFTYRLAPEWQYPASFEDTVSVSKWIIDNNEKYGFDTDHIFAVGDSAGAHMLALYAAALTNPAFMVPYDLPADFHLKAVALNCGIYLMKKDTIDDSSAALMKVLLPEGGSDREFREISSVYHITPSFPPAFIMTCPGDLLYHAPEDLIPVLKKNNVPFVYRIFGNGANPLKHVFHCDMNVPEAKVCNDEECAFFREFSD